MNKIYLTCENCGFKASRLEDDEPDIDDEIMEEDGENDFCPICMSPVVEVDEGNEVEMLRQHRLAKDKNNRITKFEIED